MLYTSDPQLRRDFQLQRNFGIENEVLVSQAGGNAKMNEFQAAMGLLVLEKIDALIQERAEISNWYACGLADIPGIKFCGPPQTERLRYNYAYLPVRVQPEFGISRDALYEFLKTKEIYTRRYFYPLTNAFECYKGRFDPALTPAAGAAAEEILALPIYNGLSREEVDYICSSIRRAPSGRSTDITDC